MGSTERRVACLRIAAQMNKRMDKAEEAPTADELIEYASKLELFAYNGKKGTP